MKYTDQHEWIRIEGNIGTVGITEYAAKELGDVVYTELPTIGKKLGKGAEAAVVESVKAASEIYSPVSGEVTEVNTALASQPDLINSDPVGVGWFFKITILNPQEIDGLMDESEYQKYIEKNH